MPCRLACWLLRYVARRVRCTRFGWLKRPTNQVPPCSIIGHRFAVPLRASQVAQRIEAQLPRFGFQRAVVFESRDNGGTIPGPKRSLTAPASGGRYQPVAHSRRAAGDQLLTAKKIDSYSNVPDRLAYKILGPLA
jgi:hypothetical protein